MSRLIALLGPHVPVLSLLVLYILVVDLRELSRGIHPAILTEGGLPPALRALARRSPSTAAVLVGCLRDEQGHDRAAEARS